MGIDADAHWQVAATKCPACNRLSFFLQSGYESHTDQQGKSTKLKYVNSSVLVRPRGISRSPVPADVPAVIADEYKEACLVLADSPKASAALSRRCLQHVLRSAAGVTAGNLAAEIQQVLDSGKLPSHLAESIDAVRNIGNFSAHPQKSTTSGAIVDVEPEEAEWNLDVLEALFDFYFVQPALIKAKRDALNKKLGEAGKPPMKG